METNIEPKWATAGIIKQLFGINRKNLREYEVAGYIRSLKRGRTKQSQKTYCCEDIDELIKRQSAGKDPRIKRGRL